VTDATKYIIVESATFNQISIYRTSRSLKLVTDASVRFAHGLSPELAAVGLARAAELLTEVVGAAPRERFDSRTKPFPRHVLKLDAAWVNRFLGTAFTAPDVDRILTRVGFTPLGGGEWQVPPLRMDIGTHEDLAEEVIRIHGLNRLAARAPRIEIKPPEPNDAVLTREKAKLILTGLGFNEVYLNSFVPATADPEPFAAQDSLIGPENPLSADLKYLRPSLTPNLLVAAAANARRGNEARLFEVGNVFTAADGARPIERSVLGIVLAGKDRGVFFALKGVVMELVRGLGIGDAVVTDARIRGRTAARIETAGRKCGLLALMTLDTKDRRSVAVAELDLATLIELEKDEAEFRPLPKFPSVMRDLSMLVPASVKIGDLMEEIELTGRKLIADVDLVDEYVDPSWRGKQSVTFRIVFQASDRTLTADEVEREVKKITTLLAKRFSAEIR
ncbi:MAG: phenylalanine--tRNA ligase beta subunit-related protein, partial [Patescibacteria group bacterium]